MVPALNLDRGLGWIGYVSLGALLFGVKIAIDFVVARLFGRSYSILAYLRAADSPLLRPAESPGYWLMMWAVALPFIAAGLVFTIRRLRDARLPDWLALLFFVPFANIMFFGFCSLVPGSRTTGRVQAAPAEIFPSGRRGAGSLAAGPAAAIAGVAGAFVGLAVFGLAVPVLESYGAALFLGGPTVAGFVSAILFSHWHRPALAGALNSAVLAVLIAGAF